MKKEDTGTGQGSNAPESNNSSNNENPQGAMPEGEEFEKKQAHSETVYKRIFSKIRVYFYRFRNFVIVLFTNITGTF